MSVNELQEKIDYLLSITRVTPEGVVEKESVGFNQPDFLFFRDLEVEEEIVPDALYRLKKYRLQLEPKSMWADNLENATKPECVAFKKRKPVPVEGCKLKQVASEVQVSNLKGHVWDLLLALRQNGARPSKQADGTYCWQISAEKLIGSRTQFERLGLDLTKIKIEQPSPTSTPTGLVITRNRNRLHFFFPYNVELISYLRNHPGFKYNKEDHSRSITLNSDTAESIDGFIKKVEGLKFPVVGRQNLHDLNAKVNQAIKERANAKELRESLEVIKTDFDISVGGLEELKLSPFGYQRAGIAFLDKTGGRAIIGDEMGLGKTLQALAWVVINKKRAVVVCPKSFIYGWKNEVEKFSDATVQVLGTKKVKLDGADFTIINYESVSKHDFKDFDTLIIDESHLVKNKKTSRFKEVKKLADRAKHVICLSGTAIVNRPVEFFTQLNLVKPGLTGSFGKYTNKFCGAFFDGYGWNVNGASNLDELVQLIAPVYIRRNKKDVLKDLPDKIRQEIVVLGIDVEDPEDRTYEGMLAWITRAKIHLAKSKIQATIEFAKNMVEQGDKVIIFSDYIEPVVKIAEAFGDEAICYLAELSSEERADAQGQFQEDPKKKVFVATSKIASVALTLTAASKVIFNDLPWQPATLMQAEDRAHRFGQKDTVNVYRMVARGTLDDQVTKILTEKAEILRAVLEGRSSALSDQEGAQAEKSILTDIIDVFRVQEKPGSKKQKTS